MRKWQLVIGGPVVLALIALVVVLASVKAPAASARGSKWQFLPPPGGGVIEYPAGVVCDFAVRTVFTVDKEYGLTATLPDGTQQQIVTGALKVTLTNEATGKTIAVNASGPGTITTAPDGTVTIFSRGLGVIVNTPELQQELGLPGLALLQGEYHETFYPDGTAAITYTGHLTDLCASLS